MALGKNLRALREYKQWELQDVEKASGVKVGTISAIEVRDSSHSRFTQQLAKAFGLTVEQLLSDEYVARLLGKEQEQPSYHNTIREPDTVPYLSIESHPKKLGDASDIVISQYDTGGAMGSGVLLKDQPGLIKEWRVSDDWLRLNVHRITSPKNLAIVTGFGDSMRGMYNPGDPLLVDTGINTVEFDAVYFFRVENEGFVKRLQRIPGEGILVISENKAYRDWTIKPGADFEVFARVVKVWKGEDF